jgi:hypothetical protein
VPSQKCTFLRPNCEKTNINIAEKHWPVLHIVIRMLLIQMFIYSTILNFEKIRINSTTYNLFLNITFKKNLNGSLKTISGLISVKIVFINVYRIIFRQLKFVFFGHKAFFNHVHAVKRIGK